MKPKVCISIIPAVRSSVKVRPEVRVYYEGASNLKFEVAQNGKILSSKYYELDKNKSEIRFSPSFSGIIGDISLEFYLYDVYGKLIERRSCKYEILNSQCNSSTLIDGCWISLYHWSEEEGRSYNKDLKKLSGKDWKDQISAMHKVGINGVILQNVFFCNEYVEQHNMTAESYWGQSFYPSRLYKRRFPIAAEDAIEAILSAADELNMYVMLGVGLYAWFDYSPQSLKWHIEVTRELKRLYGHHPSLYGWYISEEMFGSLYYEYPPVENEKYLDVVNFFKEYTAFVRELTPTKPVALAPNNIRFHEYEKEWKEILVNVDILIPFAFARDPEHLNINEIAGICKACNTHFWVDMEMFAFPLDNGLVPKKYEDLIKEIRTYDMLEQIYGYQFTGLMNFPECRFDLGGKDAKKLYEEYEKYYKKIVLSLK